MNNERLLRAYQLYNRILDDMMRRTERGESQTRQAKHLLKVYGVIVKELDRRGLNEDTFDSYRNLLIRAGNRLTLRSMLRSLLGRSIMN